MDAETLKLIGSGTMAGALLALIYIVGMRIVAALDRTGAILSDHTKVDLEHHAGVRQDIAKLDGKIDGLLDAQERTERRATPALGVVRPNTER